MALFSLFALLESVSLWFCVVVRPYWKINWIGEVKKKESEDVVPYIFVVNVCAVVIIFFMGSWSEDKATGKGQYGFNTSFGIHILKYTQAAWSVCSRTLKHRQNGVCHGNPSLSTTSCYIWNNWMSVAVLHIISDKVRIKIRCIELQQGQDVDIGSLDLDATWIINSSLSGHEKLNIYFTAYLVFET